MPSISHTSKILGGLALSAFILCVGSPAQSVAPDTLTVQRAIALGLDHHPSLRAAEAGVLYAEGGKKLALSTYFPAVNFSASGTHNEGAFVFNPSFAPSQQIYTSYTTGFSATQMLYDFGKTSNRVGANTGLVRAAQEDYRSARDAVVNNVQVAFFASLEAKDVIKVNEETVQQAEDHLRQAKAFYSVGKRPLLDVRRAEVDVANANLGLIHARNLEQVSRLQLENALGMHLSPGFILKGSVDTAGLTITLDSARISAVAHRPDILSASARYESFSSLAAAAWYQHLPTLSANGTYNWSGFDQKLYGRWTAGVTFSLPIFQGFGINAQVQQAEAAAEAQMAEVKLTLENALLDVEQTYLSVREAEERIAATEKLVDQAEESLRLAEKQYAAGVGTSLEVTDAQITRSNARISSIQSTYDHTIALTRLARAMGIMR